MQEFGIDEVVTKVSIFAVTSGETCEPIVGNIHARLDLADAAVLEASLVEHGYLVDHMACSIALVRSWEHISVVEEYDSHASLEALVDSELHCLVLDLNSDVQLEADVGWVIGKISSLTLSISLVVWGDDSDLLSELHQSNG